MKRAGGSAQVFVRGFDFGTTDEQFEGHMSQVGTIEKVKWITKGSAEVVYSSADEAALAVETLNNTTIDGNTRFIEVNPSEERESKSFKSGGGSWSKGWDPYGMMGTFAQMKGGGGKSWAKGGGNPWVKGGGQPAPWGGKGGGQPAPWGGKGGGQSAPWGGKGGGGGGGGGQPAPAGSGRVFVRGFDFGTDDEQFEGHMKAAGVIHSVKWVTKGSAEVTYKTKASAVKAVSMLNQTTIEGNSRYIDVILKDD